MVAAIRVLYAEDSPEDAAITQAYLAKHAAQFELRVVDCGEDCLKLVAQESFDVLLLDYNLPDMDGLEVLAGLSQQGSWLPVVVVTGVGRDEVAIQVLRGGASDYVTKSTLYLRRLPIILKKVLSDFKGLDRVAPPTIGVVRTILYLEPNTADAVKTTDYLKRSAPQFDLRVVCDAAQIFGYFSDKHPVDLILTDLQLPGTNALELIHESQLRGIDAPYIIVTAQGDEDSAVTALKLGAYDYVVKRGDYLTHLAYTITSAIQRHELDQKNRRLQTELKLLNQSLESKVRERTAQLTKEIKEHKRADAANLSKSLFLSKISHEIRTPMNSII